MLVTDEDLQLMSKDTTQATRCFFCRFDKSFFLSRRKEKWWEMKMRQTKKRGTSKRGFFSWIAKYKGDLSDSFQTYCAIPCCKKTGR